MTMKVYHGRALSSGLRDLRYHDDSLADDEDEGLQRRALSSGRPLGVSIAAIVR